jgi:uncharacterized membrane protein YoaK (UPF0700 family)
MPLNRLSQLTASERIAGANLQLGVTLAAVAGALNAGGFLAIGQYTSHMSGVVSGMADMLVLQHWALVVAALLSLLAFLAGAMSSALLVSFARRRHSATRTPRHCCWKRRSCCCSVWRAVSSPAASLSMFL